uniref:Uncharacterized protein n=1 Tax=Rhizophora mucronata TaxID=61149 RepID=A0A2P2Q6T9_RHIMU
MTKLLLCQRSLHQIQINPNILVTSQLSQHNLGSS